MIEPTSAEGLDLTDPDDRAVYRQRVWNDFRHCRVEGIAKYAQQAGATGRWPTTRAGAVRALADAWMKAAR